jgi:hypothetical protein
MTHSVSFFSLLCLVGSEDVYICNESCTWLTINSCKHLEIKKRTDKKKIIDKSIVLVNKISNEIICFCSYTVDRSYDSD